MTSPAATELTALLAGTRYLLLDFDGPICAIFGGRRSARDVVLELLEVLLRDDAQIPQHVASTTDPFDVLRYAATVAPDLTVRVEHRLREAEIEAVRTAAPTPHSTDVIDAWRHARRTAAVVSNNSEAAVKTYLADQGVELDLVAARTSPDPALLKPSPYLVNETLRRLDAEPDACTLVGDSVSDIVAARDAGIASIGYANKPGKHRTLHDAGAHVIVDHMQAIAEAVAIAAH